MKILTDFRKMVETGMDLRLPHHPSYTVPNSSTYTFWATLSNSSTLGRISVSNAPGIASKGIDLSNWSTPYPTIILYPEKVKMGAGG